MKRKVRKLALRKETIRNLDGRDLKRAGGAKAYDTLSLGNTRCSTSGVAVTTHPATWTCEHDTL